MTHRLLVCLDQELEAVVVPKIEALALPLLDQAIQDRLEVTAANRAGLEDEIGQLYAELEQEAKRRSYGPDPLFRWKRLIALFKSLQFDANDYAFVAEFPVVEESDEADSARCEST